MTIVIKYRCEFCSRTTMWLYDEGNGLYPDRIRGCPGKGCTNAHKISVVEIDDDEAQEFRSNNAVVVESKEG